MLSVVGVAAQRASNILVYLRDGLCREDTLGPAACVGPRSTTCWCISGTAFAVKTPSGLQPVSDRAPQHAGVSEGREDTYPLACSLWQTALHNILVYLRDGLCREDTLRPAASGRPPHNILVYLRDVKTLILRSAACGGPRPATCWCISGT